MCVYVVHMVPERWSTLKLMHYTCAYAVGICNSSFRFSFFIFAFVWRWIQMQAASAIAAKSVRRSESKRIVSVCVCLWACFAGGMWHSVVNVLARLVHITHYLLHVAVALFLFSQSIGRQAHSLCELLTAVGAGRCGGGGDSTNNIADECVIWIGEFPWTGLGEWKVENVHSRLNNGQVYGLSNDEKNKTENNAVYPR